VRALIKTRKALKALDADASFEVIYAESGKLPFVYTRAKDEQKLLIAINPSNQAVSVELPKDVMPAVPQTLDGPQDAFIVSTETGWKLTLNPVSGAVFKIS